MRGNTYLLLALSCSSRLLILSFCISILLAWLGWLSLGCSPGDSNRERCLVLVTVVESTRVVLVAR